LQRSASRVFRASFGRDAEIERMKRALDLANQDAADRRGLSPSRSWKCGVLRVQRRRAIRMPVVEASSVSHGKASAYLPMLDSCTVLQDTSDDRPSRSA